MEVIPTGSALGAEVSGIDICKPLSAAEVDFVRTAWHQNLVIFIREQPMTVEQHMAFTKNFGELELSGNSLFKKNFSGEKLGKVDGVTPPQISIVSNIKIDGRPIGSLGNAEAVWHSDSSLVECPPAGGFLHSREIPPEGGATHFLNMYLALETMPAALRTAIEGRNILHPASHSSDQKPRKGFENVTDFSQVPGMEHPAICTHPGTGRKALYLGRRLWSRFPDMPIDESEDLLNTVWGHTTQEKFTYKHEWGVGDLVVWDNRCAMHRRDSFDANARRLMHRTQIKGHRPHA
jgi:taurine dioxygenase